ncbi:hypothetical protein [Phyllobacterium endophyticum]|uniref:hypothetical protein n=1 Tax=Phyllobacterium endophyticum TaxID=1149773 RepID=UPI0011C7B29C|nr:hypothetical protein [Phyllobacterium endophyticum]TXR49894.1 hypothetical protein FVA77_07730 [Phyllobacterium endophyticum]
MAQTSPFASAPFLYPQGSFYQKLDQQITTLEQIMGTGPGVFPDYSCIEQKFADGAVTTEKILPNSVTSAKFKDAGIEGRSFAPNGIKQDNRVQMPVSNSLNFNARTLPPIVEVTLAGTTTLPSNWNNTTGELTVLSTGEYLLYVQPQFSNIVAGYGNFIFLYVNGVRIVRWQSIGSNTIDWNFLSRSMSLTAGDKIRFTAQENSPGDSTLNFYFELTKLTF